MARLSGHPQRHPRVPGWVAVPTEPLTQQEVRQPQGHVEGGEEQVGAGLGRLRHVPVETHGKGAQGLGHRRPLRPCGCPAGLGWVLVTGAQWGACAQGAEGILGGPGGSSCCAPAGGGPGLLGCWSWLLGVQGLLALEGDVQGGLLLGAGRRRGRRRHVPQRGWGGTWGRRLCRLRRAQAQRAGRSLRRGDLGTGTPVSAGRGAPGGGEPTSLGHTYRGDSGRGCGHHPQQGQAEPRGGHPGGQALVTAPKGTRQPHSSPCAHKPCTPAPRAPCPTSPAALGDGGGRPRPTWVLVGCSPSVRPGAGGNWPAAAPCG